MLGVGIAMRKKKTGRAEKRPSFFTKKGKARRPTLRMHPLFLLTGVWFACTGELFLFLLSTLVALQHECAHAFAAAKLGYSLNAVVLMPFGAVIDGDLTGISLKDEIFVALCGPLCNLATAALFVAVWWFAPTAYAFTDTVFYSSLSIALVNLLPLYPLDGGRVFRCLINRLFLRTETPVKAERKAEWLCRGLTLAVASLFLLFFLLQCLSGAPNFTLLAFGCFLFAGGVGNREEKSVYERMDFRFTPSLKKGVEIRRVAMAEDCAIKEVFPFIVRGSYLVVEVYGKEGRSFELPQNELATLFERAESPYETLLSLYKREKNVKKAGISP